ncbi:hypothetical protein H2204_006204 [Knufia peltigerae]|uniref:Multicopper oxidase n=1 Tax=Knufia peltigerae TaxID=1002370 RepID=A0AA38Y4D8_9EURO|nr:hypothetical protein H2204_006204 [Knufia peltigerae]
MVDHKKVLVLALNGPAVGGGAAWFEGQADIVLAAEGAYLQVPFSALGLVPEFGSATAFAHSMGVHRANDFLMFGRKLTVEELEKYGMVNRILPKENFHQKVLEFLEDQLEVNDGKSMMEMKRLQNIPLRRDRLMALYDALDALAERITENAHKKRFAEKNAELNGSFAALLAAPASIAASSHSSTSSNSSICSTASACKPFLIEVTWGPTDPSNVLSREAILTNGSFPGPPLRLNVGECVDFTVVNNMPNVTGVHFHGIRQLGTPWSDGVPGVSQYSIKPGSSHNYQWTAEESGVYFYHSHYKGQMMDGLYGAIIISPNETETRPFSLISNSSTDIEKMMAAEAKVETILTSDWNRYTFNEFFEIEKTANIDYSCTDSFVLNGMGSVYCLPVATLNADKAPQASVALNGSSLTAKGCIPPNNVLVQGNYNRNLAALPAGAYSECTPYTGKNFTYTVDASDEWASLAFISPSGTALFKITIDSHKMYVYEVNGNYVEPQAVDQIELDNGDRISVMVKLDQTPADYTIRVANSGLNQVISGYGILSYQGGSGPAASAEALMNYGGQNTTTITALNRAIAYPYPAATVSSTADTTFVLDIMKDPQEALSWAWSLNGVDAYNQSRDDETPPLLYESPADIPQSDLILRTNYNDWVDLIIKVAGPLAEPHPIHKHANKFFVIGAGTGDFNYTTVAQAQSAGMQFNFDNPPYADGYTTTEAEGPAWMVLRYQANTPGAWLLHCHVQSHLTGGMAVAILDAVDRFPTVPSDVGEVCSNAGSALTDDGTSPNSSSVTVKSYTGSAATSSRNQLASALGLGLALVGASGLLL